MSYYPVAHYLRDHGVTQKILCDQGGGGGYEVSYNLRGGMLSPDDLIEVDKDLHKFTDFWVVIDPIDKDRRSGNTYDYIRNNADFVLESQIQIKTLRLEHYEVGVIDASRLAPPHPRRTSAASESSP